MARRVELLQDDGIRRQDFVWDSADPDQFHIVTRENETAMVEKAKRLRDALAPTKGREMRHLAEIPMSVYERAVREGWSEDPAAWKRFLNDPDNAALRIEGGRV